MSPAASPGKGASPGGRTLRSATKAARSALGLNGETDSGSNGAGQVARMQNGSNDSPAKGSPAKGGPTNGSAGLADGRTNGRTAKRRGDGGSGGLLQRLVANLRQPLAALGGLLLADAPAPPVPRQYRAANGAPALHGVVHQISEADMAQIQATEGGGGNQNHGYK